jgi:coniferyl-aldehyde dehydrogenase
MSATTVSETSQAELSRLFEAQKTAFAADRYPSLEERIQRLKRLEALLRAYRVPFQETIAQDFGAHPPFVSDVWETGHVINRSRYIRSQLADWMAPDLRSLNPAVHGTSVAKVVHRPKGVIGNIAPWNFPVECALVMVADMLAGGNRVIVKTSEYVPATSSLLQEEVTEHFDEDLLAVITGGPEVGELFAEMPWNHLCYTGSTRVGRLVMQAAAKNLVPVTLEMGGKNPAVFMDDAVTPEIVERFLYFKALKAGQVCTVPDYAMVPEGRIDEWVALAKERWTGLYPDSYVDHPDATGIISEAHYERILGYVEEARAAGVEVVSLNGDEPNASRRTLPMYVAIDPPEHLLVMQEEIFGPLVSVVPHAGIDDAIDRINERPSPLGSYLATFDAHVASYFAENVAAGGLGVNVFGFWAGQPCLPFGGVGASGMGCHSGREGWLNYTHAKSVFVVSEDNPIMHAIKPNFGETANQLADAMFAADD